MQSGVCPYRLHASAWTSVRLVGHKFSPKIASSPLGIITPHNILFLWISPLIMQNGISIGSAVFEWVTNAMLYNALSVGKKTPKIAPWGFRYPARGELSHGHQQHAKN